MNLLWIYINLILLILNSKNFNCTITENFRNYIRNKYGADTEKLMSREDVGGGGSFGGGLNHVPNQKTDKRPVILVHGITNTAGTFSRIQHFFLQNGYKDEEVYGTTYGDGGQTNVILVTMNCHFAKVIRMFISIVAEYTNSKVNIIAYSMGSPVARKAIKGGICVDTNEDIGPPLTGLIETFVGVAGANYGSFLCIFPVGSCNLLNGMGCGSKYLNDINYLPRFEGTNVYTIYSTGDDKVGHYACGHLASEIRGQDQAYVKTNLNHDSVMYDTAQLQYNLVTYNHA